MSLYIPSFSEILAVAESRGALSDAPHLWDGLVGAWPLQQAGGSTAFDVSGWGSHGTLTNMDPATDWIVRQKGRALDFDGAGDNVSVADKPNLAVTTLSALVWVQLSSVLTWRYFFSRWGANHCWTIGTNGSARWLGYVYNEANALGQLHSRIVADTAIHHLALVHDNVNVRLYLDARVIQTAALTGNTKSAASDLSIGTAGGAEGCVGWVSDALLYSRALSPSDIQELYEDPPAMYRLRRRPFAATAATPSTIELPTIALAI